MKIDLMAVARAAIRPLLIYREVRKIEKTEGIGVVKYSNWLLGPNHACARLNLSILTSIVKIIYACAS